MTARKVWDAGAWVTIGTAGLAADVTGASLTDASTLASSSRPAKMPSAGSPSFVVGSWTELDASLSDDASGITLMVGSVVNAAADCSTLLEIGIGAAAAETVWATIQIGYNDSGFSHCAYHVPGHIAAGTRVAVRLRSALSGKSVPVIPVFHAAPTPVTLGAPVDYGVNTGTARGVTITAPGSLNTKGAWTEITAATAADLVALTVNVGYAGATDPGSGGVLIDIGYGAAAAEQVLIADLFISVSNTPSMIRRFPPSHAVTVPTGSRLVARYARSSSSTTLDVHLIGTPAA